MFVRVCLVSTVRIHREALTSALAGVPAIQIVAALQRDAGTASRIAALNPQPDVVLCDLPVHDCVEFAEAMRVTCRAPRLVAFGVDEFEPEILVCAKAGMSAFVPREASVEELAATLTGVLRNELRCSPAIAAQLFRRLAQPMARAPEPSTATLTAREREVFALVREGLANKEIAARLQISEATVKNHVHHLLEKLQVKRRVQAARVPASILYRSQAG